MDFNIVKHARIRPGEFSHVVGVSRVTASMWLNGHKQPHHLLTDRVTIVLDQVAAAVEAKRLPVPLDVARTERLAYIQSALAQP